jgi:3-deoxy-D-manno-octulosonic acid kinase
MRDDGIDRPDAGAPRPGAGSRDEHPIVRTRIGRYTCHLAYPLCRDELRELVTSLATPAGARAVPLNGGVLSGRAAIWRHEIPSIGTVVIKEYRRGGMLRFLRRRHYFRFGVSRPEREFNNLRTARATGLNVPNPVGCFSRGALFYRGWLATCYVPGRSLVDIVSSDPGGISALIEELTRQVELLIKNRVAHVDLHPGNVLVSATGTLYLLDFDRAIVFSKSEEELRHHYDVRWKRAVEKHGLPRILSDRFSEGLYGLPHRDR